MTKQTTAAATTEDRALTEFVPFGARDAIKLSVSIVKNLVAVPTKTKQLPSDRDCIKFVAMCKARGLNPFEGDAFLIGYDSRAPGEPPTFSLITAHQAFLKRAELNLEYNGMKSGVIVKRNEEVIDLPGDFHLDSDVVVGGWATVFFKNRENPMHKRVRLKRFQKPFGVWQDDPGGMICKCAEADALRSSFPTMLGGLYTREETPIDDGPKMSVPIFTAPPDLPKESRKVLATSTTTPLQVVEGLCDSDGIKHQDLMSFLIDVGLAQEGDNMEKLTPDTLDTVINQWDDFATRIREVLG